MKCSLYYFLYSPVCGTDTNTSNLRVCILSFLKREKHMHFFVFIFLKQLFHFAVFSRVWFNYGKAHLQCKCFQETIPVNECFDETREV